MLRVEQRHTRLPLLVPDQPQHCDCFIRALSNVTGQIRVSIAKNNNPKPIASLRVSTQFFRRKNNTSTKK